MAMEEEIPGMAPPTMPHTSPAKAAGTTGVVTSRVRALARSSSA